MRMKRILSLLLMMAVLLTASVMAFADGGGTAGAEAGSGDSAAARGLAALEATGKAGSIQLPKEESYLSEWKTLYSRKAFKAPCLAVESVPKMQSGRATMPWLYEGTEVTVVAEENEMSCIIYRSYNNKQYVGWIKSIRLLEEFPGEVYTLGEEPSGSLSVSDDITLTWSQRGIPWNNTYQPYSILSETVENCCGFTFEYQVIAENTQYWNTILGPRKVYVKSDGVWKEVGEFPYPAFGAVKMQVWLEEPMDIEAIGTIAQCRLPDQFNFRQTASAFVTSG